MKNRFKNKKGFTIIELIVVMAIIGVLVLLAIPKFMGYTEKARVTEIKSNTKQLENASERYYIDKNDWPRLTDTPYTSAQLISFAQEITDKIGQVVTLDVTGSYYDIDYSKIQVYVQKPKDNTHYIIQNPVGEIYYLKNLTTLGESTLGNIPLPNNKPVAVITMTPGIALTTDTNITWGYSNSTDPDGDTITNAEWKNKQSIYSTAGSYTIDLRVQDSKGLWSDWSSKSFIISQYVNNVGQIMSTVGAGWQRFDDYNNMFKYVGNWETSTTVPALYNNTAHWIHPNGSESLKFTFYGTKLKYYTNMNNSCSSSIRINIDGNSEYFNEYSNTPYTTSTQPSMLIYEKIDLPLGIHTVVVNVNMAVPAIYSVLRVMGFDAIDIDNTGYLVTP